LAKDALNAHPHVLKDSALSIGVSHLGHPAITIAVEPWTSVVHHGSAQGEINKATIERFRAAVQIESPPRLLSRSRKWCASSHSSVAPVAE